MKSKIVEVQEMADRPASVHDDEHYMHVEFVKQKGRRKKNDPYHFLVAVIPWEDLNHTELLTLCLYNAQVVGSRSELEMWRVVHRGLNREVLIGLIRGEVDPKTLPTHPVHRHRELISKFLYNNWRFINSQVQCDLECWRCPDAKVMETFFENRRNLPGESR